MTARGTDWSLAALVAGGVLSGLALWFAATPGTVWVFTAHAVVGYALAAVVVVKVRRVLGRLRRPARWDAKTARGLAALACVAAVVVSGIVWAGGGNLRLGIYNLLNLHNVAGGTLAILVLAHAVGRAKPLRRGDALDRRQVLTGAGIAAFAVAAHQVQRPLSGALGLRGADRRFTGSYPAGDFRGNSDFPATSWVSDDPRVIAGPAFRLAVRGSVGRQLSLPARELDAGDELVATLDCTGGFFTTQRWRGVLLGRLIDRAGVADGASHVRVISYTGYRASFTLDHARGLLLATHVGGEPLTHGHGAPARLVVPQRRGFQWVKWVVALELADGPDPGALASTLWSSLTAEGRGSA